MRHNHQDIPALYVRAACITLLLISCLKVESQSIIHGEIRNIDGKTISNANVLLLNAIDSSLYKGKITQQDGSYVFEKVPAGKYMVSASFTGFKQVFSSIMLLGNNEKKDLGILTLSEKEEQLTAINLSVKKPLFEQKIDRMIVNVKNSITSAGSTALDILERSPGVIVNRQSNDIAMNGKAGVVIMINGKINRLPLEAVMQMLAGMSSGNIERIELITTPPANFDAEGNAGFINIVMINNPEQGTNGNYSVTMGFGGGEMSRANINVNHRKNKLNLYSDYSFSRQHQSQVFALSRRITVLGKVTETSTRSERDPTVTDHNGRLGMDYQLNKKTVFGSMISFYSNRWAMDAHTDGKILINNVLDTSLSIANTEVNQWNHQSIAVSIQHNVKAGEKLTLNLDYLNYANSNPNEYINSYFKGSGTFLYDDKARSRKNTPIAVWVGSADYAFKPGKNTDLEFGIKASLAKFVNDVSIENFMNNAWIIDPGRSAKYNLKEDITAAYTAISLQIDMKTTMKLGTRFEYTNSNLGTETKKNIVDRKYGRLFPSFFISRRINDNNTVNFAYSYRITRPTFNQLAPFVYLFDPSTFIQGNPALQPAFSNSIKVDYTLKRYIFSLTYSHVKDAISRFQSKIDSTTNKQVITGENLKSVNTISSSLSLPFTITAWWTMQNNLIGTWQQVEANVNDKLIKAQQYNGRFNTTQSFKLNKNLSMEITGFYQSPSLAGRSISRSFGALNTGIQKKFKGKNSSLRFNVTDIFNTQRFRFYDDFQQNQYNDGALQFQQRTFSLTFSNSFGNEKLKARRNLTGAEEERRRVE